MAYTNLSDLFKGTCDAIRTKKGTTGPIKHQNIPSEIAGILSPSDGTIPTKTSNDLSASGATVTVPAGYYAKSESKSVATGSLDKPTFYGTKLSSQGILQAESKVQTNGYLTASNTSDIAEYYLNTVNGGNTITPGTLPQTAVPKNYFTLGEVKVAGDSNLVASNIKNGVSIFGVQGNYQGSGSSATGHIEDCGEIRPSYTGTFSFNFSGNSNNIIGFCVTCAQTLIPSNESDEYITSIFVNGTYLYITAIDSNGRSYSYSEEDVSFVTSSNKVTFNIEDNYLCFSTSDDYQCFVIYK